MIKTPFIILACVLVSSCSIQSINNGTDASLSELSFAFHKQLDKHDVQLSVIDEYISEYGMYILRVDGSKYFKQNAAISIDPEQVYEFDKLVLKIKKAMAIVDKEKSLPIGGIGFSMVYHDKKEFSRINTDGVRPPKSSF